MIVVYKLGGSLLDLPDLPSRLTWLFAARPTSRPLLIVGGGPTADLVRAWDKIHRLTDDAAHRLALEAMRLNETFVRSLLPRATIVGTRAEAETAWNENRLPILCAADFLDSEEATLSCDRAATNATDRSDGEFRNAVVGDALGGVEVGSAAGHPECRPRPDRPLPRTWDVTSDSIAAWVALRWPADELVMLKSTSPEGTKCPFASTMQEVEQAQFGQPDPGTPGKSFVDPRFGALARGVARTSFVNLRHDRWADPS